MKAPTRRRKVSQPRLSWDDLQVFVAVAQAGSIAGAAKALGVNHSTVLRRIGSLEQAVAVRLFDRLPSGYALTASGNLLAERLAGVRAQIDATHRELMGLDEEIRGVIRLTSTDTLVSAVLMPLVARFREMHAGVEVQIVVNNSLLSLSKREADVAVRGSNRPPEHLVGRRIGDIQTALYASKSYVRRLGKGYRFDDLAWVAADESLGHLEQAKWLARRVAPARVAVRVDSLVGMVEAVASGLGAGLLLCPLGDARPELVRLEAPDPLFDTQVWILTHPDLRQVARIRAFTQFLFDALSTDPRFAH